jgi:hypothetical protein
MTDYSLRMSGEDKDGGKFRLFNYNLHRARRGRLLTNGFAVNIGFRLYVFPEPGGVLLD